LGAKIHIIFGTTKYFSENQKLLHIMSTLSTMRQICATVPEEGETINLINYPNSRSSENQHDWSSRDGNQLLLNLGAKTRKTKDF
jgi:hypothetical protein